jgi:Holliday junction DNA helicase RuvA
MIASLQGTIELIGSDFVIITTGGVGFRVYTSTSTISSLGKTGEEVKLHTHLYLREDNATLYGFTTIEELSLFQTLIGVSGLGPRLALAMLSSMKVDSLMTAIATASVELLTEIPGIGKKMANRLILELKDKISAGMAIAPATEFAQENADLMAALTSLGYSVSEASRAAATIPPDSDLSLEEKVKLALQYFGGA